MIRAILNGLKKNQIRLKKSIVCVLTLVLIVQSIAYCFQNYTLDVTATAQGNDDFVTSTSDGDANENQSDGEVDGTTNNPSGDTTRAISDDGGKTIFFDTSGNGTWTGDTNGWAQNNTMYIYLVGVQVAGEAPREMTVSSRTGSFQDVPSGTGGVLWEYTISPEEYETCTAIIFTPYSPWLDNAPASQTVDISLELYKNDNYPYFRLNGGSQDSKKTVAYKNLTLLSQANNTIHFVNMTTVPLEGVTACFGGDGIAKEEDMIATDGYYSVQIPSDETVDGKAIAYQTVYFKDSSGNTLGEIYHFLNSPSDSEVGFAYEAGTRDTFYYSATENTDGTKIHTWDALTTGADSLVGKTLYFDKTYFTVGKPWKLQIGNDESGTIVELSADSEDEKTISYVFSDDSTATQQTILTVITPEGTKYHFKWSDFGSEDALVNEATLGGNIIKVAKTYIKTCTIYFDATLSKLSYAGSADQDASMPASGETICYYAWNTKEDAQSGVMEKMVSFSSNGNTWNDVYKADLEKEFANIVFYSSKQVKSWPIDDVDNARKTVYLTIPTDLHNPCFYADTSDPVIYDAVDVEGREGYWQELYTIRNAEQYKTDKDVVDIKESAFTREDDVFYVNSTFYDYYSDYELNGNNRDEYGGINTTSHRNWVNFRQFNQALSDYYRQASVSMQIYTGHFQPPIYQDYPFEAIADTLNLYGWENMYKFLALNNSQLDSDGNSGNYGCVAQGIVLPQLENEKLMVSGSEAVPSPHFNEAFLTGNNSKNAVLGEVYQNVQFPFRQKEDASDVTYWYFNSADTTLAMRKNSTGNGYHLQEVGNQDWSKNVNSTGYVTEDGVSATYGFFPFNETSTGNSGKNYNYGFGTRLDFTFRLTKDGYVLDPSGRKVPITFEFAGDDDVWVFIDGELVLDVGGDHGIVTGTLDFASQTSTVSDVKKVNDTDVAGTSITKFNIGDRTETHTLTMFYMERGMWESNMQIKFNFADRNQLEVEKEVDTTEVNDIFKNLFEESVEFTFHIKNLATHFGEKEVVNEENLNLPKVFNTSFEEATVSTKHEDNSFDSMLAMAGHNTVVHWLAKADDKLSSFREDRCGMLTSESGETVDISKMDYLEFDLYYDYTDAPSLSYMYLQLVDANGKVKGNIDSSDNLSDKSYGSVIMAGKTWVTIRIDLSKLNAEDGFNNQVKEIRFGYNYQRNMYLDDFIFYSSKVEKGRTGFVMKQYVIPDYRSATSGILKIPEGAGYITSSNENRVISENGIFVLGDGEGVIFYDQFREGSYIALQEDTDEALYDTTWTMYENGEPVTSMGTGDTVTNGSVTTLSNVEGLKVNDGRTEKYQTGIEDGDRIENAYTGTKPSEDTFVFRSFLNPDDNASATKLKVVYTNKVKTGAIKVEKKQAEDSDELTETYTIRIAFSNIAGVSLERQSIIKDITLKAGESVTIEGIPVGTHYTITEIMPTDGSRLTSIVQMKDSEGSVLGNDTDVNIEENTTVTGVVVGDEGEEAEPTGFIFENLLPPTIHLSVEKKWNASDGTEVTTGLPESIWIQIQRKVIEEEDFEPVTVEGYTNDDACIELKPGEDGWKIVIESLDKFEDEEQTKPYTYRVLEMEKKTTVDGQGKTTTTFTEVTDSIWFGTLEFEVEYDEEITLSKADKTKDYSYEITNTKMDKFDVQFTKVKGSGDNMETLAGAEFTLYTYKGTEPIHTYEGFMASVSNVANIELWETKPLTEENAVFRLEDLNQKYVYYLVETKVPDGMQEPGGCWKIAYIPDTETSDDGTIHNHVKITALPKSGDTSTMPAFGYITDAGDNGIQGWFITNLEQWTVPDSGGEGTGYPYTAGACLMLIAVIWGGSLYYRRKKLRPVERLNDTQRIQSRKRERKKTK